MRLNEDLLKESRREKSQRMGSERKNAHRFERKRERKVTKHGWKSEKERRQERERNKVLLLDPTIFPLEKEEQ